MCLSDCNLLCTLIARTMYHSVRDGPCGGSVRLTIKHTFIEFQCLDEDDSPKLRRHNSDPSLQPPTPTYAAAYAAATCKCTEPPTPTTCASVNSDDDDEYSLSSPISFEEDDASSDGNKWSFSNLSVDGLYDFPQVPSRDATRNSQAGMAWPQNSTFAVFSTCPQMPQADYTAAHSYDGAEGPQTSLSDTQIDDSLHANTTLMVRNLPTDLSQPAFVQQFIETGWKGLFDFVYMPMNLRGHGNFGYAFINFASHSLAAQVMRQMPNSEPDGWTSVWSTCQGLSANIERYRNSPLMHELVPKECKPAAYDHSGNQIPFPSPTKNIPKPRIHWSGPREGKNLKENDGHFELPSFTSGTGSPATVGVAECRPGRAKKHQRQQRAN